MPSLISGDNSNSHMPCFWMIIIPLASPAPIVRKLLISKHPHNSRCILCTWTSSNRLMNSGYLGRLIEDMKCAKIVSTFDQLYGLSWLARDATFQSVIIWDPQSTYRSCYLCHQINRVRHPGSGPVNISTRPGRSLIPAPAQARLHVATETFT